MSLVKAGIPKSLNIKAQSGSLNAMKASFASATRAQGISYDIMAQRSIFSTNILTNPKLAYSPEVASIRGQLNPPKAMLFADVMPHQCHNSGDDTMNKFMMGMIAMNKVFEMTAGITKGIKEIKASKTAQKEAAAAKAEAAAAKDFASVKSEYKDQYNISSWSDGTFRAKSKDGKTLVTADSALELRQKLDEANGIQVTKPTSGADNVDKKENKSNASEDVQGIITQMTSANTSATLQSAIDGANTKLNEIGTELADKKLEKQTLEGKTKGLQSALEKAKKDVRENAEKRSKAIEKQEEKQDKLNTKQANLKKLMNDGEPVDSDKVKSLQAEIKELNTDVKKYAGIATECVGKIQSLASAEKSASDALTANTNAISTLDGEITTLTTDQTSLRTEIPTQEVRLQELKAKEAASAATGGTVSA